MAPSEPLGHILSQGKRGAAFGVRGVWVNAAREDGLDELVE